MWGDGLHRTRLTAAKTNNTYAAHAFTHNKHMAITRTQSERDIRALSLKSTVRALGTCPAHDIHNARSERQRMHNGRGQDEVRVAGVQLHPQSPQERVQRCCKRKRCGTDATAHVRTRSATARVTAAMRTRTTHHHERDPHA